MNCIAAVSSNWGIGKDNGLLFHAAEDMKFFRRMTTGGTMILGRRTLESFPGSRPLPKRRHLVLTRRSGWQAEGVEIFHSVRDVLTAAEGLSEDLVWVIGGGEIYRAFLPYCRKAYITRFDSAPEADTFFPDLGADPAWSLVEEGEPMQEGDLSYRFCLYQNNAVIPLPSSRS